MQIRGYKVAQLREALQQEGLSTKGLKAELVERLYDLVQILSEDPKESTSPLDLPSTAERPSQAQRPTTAPTEPAQGALQSHTLNAQSDLSSHDEDDRAVNSTLGTTPAPLSASESEESVDTASSSTQCAERRLSGIPAVLAQQRPADHDSASAEHATLAAAAVLVRDIPQQGSIKPSKGLSTPDPVASKTGMHHRPGHQSGVMQNILIWSITSVQGTPMHQYPPSESALSMHPFHTIMINDWWEKPVCT